MSSSARQALNDFLAGVTPVSAIDDVTWRRMVRWARHDLSRQVAKIEARRSEGRLRLARRIARQTIQRLGPRFALAAEAVRNAYPDGRHSTDEQRRALQLKRMTVLKTGFPRVGRFGRPASPSMRPRCKDDGSFRPVVEFHWIDKAQQSLLSAIYKPFADFHPAQYQRKKVAGLGGTSAVREALRAALDTADDTDVFLHFDVRRHYDNTRCEWLERKLWLPREVIRGHAHTADMVIRHTGNHFVGPCSDQASWKDGRLGLPQGSALSPLLADLVMADVIRTAEVPDQYPLFIWSDNIGVIVPQREAAALEELLRSAFAEHGCSATITESGRRQL